VHPSKLVHVGQEVEVMVLDIDEERRRVSLGIKQCQANPWEEFAARHNKGDKVVGVIKSITDFGVFIGLEGGIDGLVHLSDLSWNETGEDAVRKYKKGDELEAIVLGVDAERERISLGVKQSDKDPLSMYLDTHQKGTIVRGIVRSVDAKGAVVLLADGVEGTIRASELSRDDVDDARKLLKEDQELEAMLVGVDRKKRVVTLSVKAKDSEEEAAAIQEYTAEKESGGLTRLGDLLKKKLDAQ
jgi:small subunit ribosomal protein S1